MFKKIINFQKVIQFIKYHNAFTIGLVLIFIFGASVFASDTIREATIGKAVVEKAGIDNTALLTADLGNFDFSMQIINVTEDDENYYVLYTYKTLDIQDDIWQPVSRQETMEVSKSALADRDLGLYVAEELGEIIDSQKAYLVKVQQKQKQKGITLIQETTKYTGLIGMVLNPKTRELPGYEPVVKQPEPVAVVYQESQPAEVGPLETSCNPDWVCSDWTPAESTVALEEGFTQTRTCTDQNNCGTEQAKPEEEHIAIGTYQSASAGGGTDTGSPEVPTTEATTTEATTTPTTTSTTTQATSTEPICDINNLNLCNTQSTCEATDIGGYWYSETCNSEAEAIVCFPDWQCSDWQELVETIGCGQAFTQTRICTDINECSTDENKPIETQEAIGTDCTICGITSCDGLNLIGECQNTCVDGSCSTCIPTCVCAEGFYDCDSDGTCETHGECPVSESETATTTPTG
jgi:hypothetical protein